MTYLTVSNIGQTQISVVDEAKARRDELLAEAGTIMTVTDQIDADAAGETLKALKEFTRAVEDSRKDVKAPVLELTRQIDSLAKELVTDLEAQANRISRTLGAWQAEERRKADEARRKAAEEEERIKREATRAMQAAQEQATSRNQAAVAQARIESEMVEKIVEVKQKAEEVVALSRPAGATVRETWCFEVTDIKALYQAAPYLVNLEPNGTAIRAAIKTNQDIPGLRIWKEAKAII